MTGVKGKGIFVVAPPLFVHVMWPPAAYSTRFKPRLGCTFHTVIKSGGKKENGNFPFLL